MRGVRQSLAAGLGLTALAVAAVLSRSPVTVLAASGPPPSSEVGLTRRGATACQSDERLPSGTRAIRLSLGAFTGPALSVRATSGIRVLTSGARGSGWDGETVTVPVTEVSRTISPVKVCFAIAKGGGEAVEVLANRIGPAAVAGEGRPLAGRLTIEYLGRGRSSWLALLPSIATRLGLGRAWGGAWIAVLVAILMLLATILASGLIVRELDE
ncbi:MAG TPA: hypothetical protein VIH92_13565 [Solirubrobacteraceae bacterium]